MKRQDTEVFERIDQLEADIEFLAHRAMEAGACKFTDDRETGASSNYIVAVAYGLKDAKPALPSDIDDFLACIRTFRKLPKHRITKKVDKALNNALDAIKRRR